MAVSWPTNPVSGYNHNLSWNAICWIVQSTVITRPGIAILLMIMSTAIDAIVTIETKNLSYHKIIPNTKKNGSGPASTRIVRSQVLSVSDSQPE